MQHKPVPVLNNIWYLLVGIASYSVVVHNNSDDNSSYGEECRSAILVSSSMFRKFSRTSMICDVGNSLQRAALGVAAAYGQAAWFDSQWKKGCCEEEEGVISVPHLCHHLFGHLRRTGLQPGWFSNLTPESITSLDGYVVAPSNHEHIIVQSCRSNLSTFRTNAFFGPAKVGKSWKTQQTTPLAHHHPEQPTEKKMIFEIDPHQWRPEFTKGSQLIVFNQNE